MTKLKLIVLLVLSVLAIVLVLQNTHFNTSPIALTFAMSRILILLCLFQHHAD